MIKNLRTKYQWKDESEKDTVERNLITQALISSREDFAKHVKGETVKLETQVQPRYLVWTYPVGVPHDPSGQDGVIGPLEAIQWALDLHLDGGWDWLVWDRVQKTGFNIQPNSYIYAPLDDWADMYCGITSFSQRSTEDLRKIIEAAQAVLHERESRGTL